MTRLHADAIDRLLDVHFPQAHHGGRVMFIETLGPDETVVRLRQNERNMRPGNTVSGPAMFALADWGTYVAILAQQGEAALQAVTTNITLNFMRRPEPGDILATVRLIKSGKRLIVAEIVMRSEGHGEIVTHAIATYAMPPR
ncbi:MAG: PaaI family thioesterase [Hyphomicrobiales bacterium]|nr:PaaI family thioesterase [Hyphomicrobiales bacterium]